MQDTLSGTHIDGLGFERALKRGLDYVIVGGESGAHFRPLNLGWARSLVAQCCAAGVPVFFKQVSGPQPGMPSGDATLDAAKEFPG